MPADPAFLLGFGRLPMEQIEELRRIFGLDKPMLEQYFLYVVNTLKGNFGISFFYRAPVLKVIMDFLPRTLLLSISATTLAVLISVFIGVHSASNYGKKRGLVSLVLMILFRSVPSFWLGSIFLWLFAFQLGWFPLAGMASRPPPTEPLLYIGDVLHHLILPALTLALGIFATIALILRGAMLGELSQDYVTLARAKGHRERTVLYKHALRNALLPVITAIALAYGVCLTHTLLVEIVFSWEGIGKLMLYSVNRRDYPVLQGIFFIIAIMVIFSNLIADLLYGVLDPRVKRGK